MEDQNRKSPRFNACSQPCFLFSQVQSFLWQGLPLSERWVDTRTRLHLPLNGRWLSHGGHCTCNTTSSQKDGHNQTRTGKVRAYSWSQLQPPPKPRCSCGVHTCTLWLRNGGGGEGYTTDYLLLKNEASSLGWLGLPRGLASSCLRSERSGYRDKSNHFYSHFTGPRGKMRYYTKTLAGISSSTSLSGPRGWQGQAKGQTGS